MRLAILPLPGILGAVHVLKIRLSERPPANPLAVDRGRRFGRFTSRGRTSRSQEKQNSTLQAEATHGGKILMREAWKRFGRQRSGESPCGQNNSPHPR
jgi:hypothetical protein